MSSEQQAQHVQALHRAGHCPSPRLRPAATDPAGGDSWFSALYTAPGTHLGVSWARFATSPASHPQPLEKGLFADTLCISPLGPPKQRTTDWGWKDADLGLEV